MVSNSGDKILSHTPFPAIVGQEPLKRVLLAVTTNDALDGALLTGEKGTAKSTAVRALVDLLPEQRAVADCPYGCPPDDADAQCEACRERRRSGENLPVERRPVPLVTLPLGATRDRVVGTLSVADALAGEADFDPGLLARANRGILYVDEVNLLEDHLVDVVLDAAASGGNVVERDGVSVSHPAEFTLIGTMNPEEGDLRPQLRDRFALHVEVEGARAVEERVEIIDRALDRHTDRRAFATGYADEVSSLRERLSAARRRLEEVELSHDRRVEIADLCLEAGVDGHRGDIAVARTARTLAALDGRSTVTDAAVTEAARYGLAHRLRSRPFEDAPDVEDLLADRETDDRASEDAADGRAGPGEADADQRNDLGEGANDDDVGEYGEGDGVDHHAEGDGEDHGEICGGETDGGDADSDDGPATSGVVAGSTGSSGGSSTPAETGDDGDEPGNDGDEPGNDGDEPGNDGDEPGNDGDDEDRAGDPTGDDDGAEATPATPVIPGQRRADVGTASAPHVDPPASSTRSDGSASGDRVGAAAAGGRGARVRSERAGPGDSVDVPASVRAAAARGSDRVERDDLRRSVRTTTSRATIVFAVDASASMRPAMRAAKGVVLELLRESYERRDAVAFVAFAGDDADVLLPPTESVTLAARHLKKLPTGDRTPLPAGIHAATDVLEREEPDAAVVVLVTDGRATVADGSPTAATREAARRLARTGATVLVVDAGDGGRAGLSSVITGETGGDLVSLSTLSAEAVRSVADAASTD